MMTRTPTFRLKRNLRDEVIWLRKTTLELRCDTRCSGETSATHVMPDGCHALSGLGAIVGCISNLNHPARSSYNILHDSRLSLDSHPEFIGEEGPVCLGDFHRNGNTPSYAQTKKDWSSPQHASFHDLIWYVHVRVILALMQVAKVGKHTTIGRTMATFIEDRTGTISTIGVRCGHMLAEIKTYQKPMRSRIRSIITIFSSAPALTKRVTWKD